MDCRIEMVKSVLLERGIVPVRMRVSSNRGPGGASCEAARSLALAPPPHTPFSRLDSPCVSLQTRAFLADLTYSLPMGNLENPTLRPHLYKPLSHGDGAGAWQRI